MRCLLILAHPRRDSLCGALFDACAEGARQAGVECRELILSEMQFEPNVHAVSPKQQPLEPDLVRAQRDIDWAVNNNRIEPRQRTAPAGWKLTVKFTGSGHLHYLLNRPLRTRMFGGVVGDG
jgi:hypothetical protein